MFVLWWCLLYVSCLVFLNFNTTLAQRGLHLQAFELFFRESQPSASMSPILLKTVFIKDSYKKIASNSTAMHS